MARARSLSSGRGRWACMSGRRMFARTRASPGSDFLRETACRSRYRAAANGLIVNTGRFQDWAHQPALAEDALGRQMLALLCQLTAACTAADELAQAVVEVFPQDPDADIILSFPGLGSQLGARVLAEIGDDRTRFADAPGLQAYAGASPITRASGKKSGITRRWWHRFNRLLGQLYHCLKNRRLFEDFAAFPPSGEARGTAAT